ncbi:MAG: serine/threonine-protein kinase [Limisphaerales bacterium]
MPDPPEHSDESIETLQGGTTPTSGAGGKTTAPSIVHGQTELAADSARYSVGEEIARGGMGAVIEAEETSLERTVAMKVMLSPTTNARARFIREATVLARLEHPNIVPIHELGTDEQGRLFYTMKKVEGATLQAVIKGLKRGDTETVAEWSLDHLLSVYRKVCDAIAFAHSRGIIHRDLKPDNIMLGSFGEVLVMDWGLAKLMDEEEPELPAGIEDNTSEVPGRSGSLTLDGAVIGSPQYMPPEQAVGRVDEIDERSDVFSLGGILYAILTLRPPVPNGSVSEVLEMVKSGGITPPSDLWTTEVGRAGQGPADAPDKRGNDLPHCPGGRVPKALSAVTMQAMAFAREERYAEVTDLAAEIFAYQSGYATSAEHAGALGQFWKLVMRHRGMTATAAVLLVVIGYLWLNFTIDLRAEKENALAEADNAEIA